MEPKLPAEGARGLSLRRRAGNAAEMREMLANLGKLRVDALGRITDDPEAEAAIRVIDDPGLQAALLGIRQRLDWIDCEERCPQPDHYKAYAWLTSANNFYGEIVEAIERYQRRRAGKKSGEARGKTSRDAIAKAEMQLISEKVAPRKRTSSIAKSGVELSERQIRKLRKSLKGRN